MNDDGEATRARPREIPEQPTVPNGMRAPASVRPERLEAARESQLPPAHARAAIGARSASHELRRVEALRARAFAAAVASMATLVVIAEAWLPGDASRRAPAIVCLVGLVVVSARVWTAARDVAAYTRALTRIFALAVLFGSLAATYRFGVFSPAPTLIVLSVVFFGLGEDERLAIAFAALSAVGYAALVALVSSGEIDDVSLVSSRALATRTHLPFALFVPLVIGIAVANARISRGAALDALQRSSAWFREARQRERQLEEANRDLDALLKMSATEVAPHTGAIAGKYVLAQRIGRGAMGEVYAAKDREEGQAAAVKLLHVNMQDDQMLMQRFLREGEAASRLRADNVVHVYEVGKLETGAPYIAMELLRGHDLAWHLRRRGQIPLDEVVSIVDQIAAGLEAARRAGIVHRDLKPQNLFLAQKHNAAPVWKILDFGVSRLAGSTGTLTKDVIVGTPGYMSPEQAGGLPVTHRSDVFSFGAVVYRALTGEPPFTGPDTPQILYQVVYANPPRPSALVQGLAADVDLVLAIALAKDAADRFGSAIELAVAFSNAARSQLDPALRIHGRTLLAALPWAKPRDGSIFDFELEPTGTELPSG